MIKPEIEETANEIVKPDQADIPKLDGVNDERPHPELPTAPDPGGIEVEARIPAKKDATLREFLDKMDDYAPIVYSSLRMTHAQLDANVDRDRFPML